MTLDDLEAQAAEKTAAADRAAAEARAAQSAAAEASRQADAERAANRRRYWEHVVDQGSQRRREAEDAVRAAEQAFREAVVNDARPIAAYIAWRTAHLRRFRAIGVYLGAMRALGHEPPAGSDPEPAFSEYSVLVENVLAKHFQGVLAGIDEETGAEYMAWEQGDVS